MNNTSVKLPHTSTKVQLSSIPSELTSLRQWVCWSSRKQSGGKTTKIPLHPRTGRNASHRDPDSWVDFETAVSALENSRISYDGIGFVFTADDPYCGIDLDNCRDSDTGYMLEKARTLIHSLDSYTEITPSGKGVHIIVKATLPGGGRKRPWIEIYDRLRFFTVTGRLLEPRLDSIRLQPEEILRLYRGLQPKKRVATLKSQEKSTAVPTAQLQALKEQISKSRNAHKFQLLFDGRWSEVDPDWSASEADLSFCSMVAPFCNNDPDAIDALYRQSKLYREKWDEVHYASGVTYGEETLRKATTGTDRIDSHPDIRMTFHDTGNAHRLAKEHGENIHYCKPYRKWFLYTGTHWHRDTTGQIIEKAKDTMVKLITRAAESRDMQLASKLAGWGAKSLNETRLSAMVRLARTLPGIAIQPDALDTDDYLLNCRNGTIELGTGTCRPHRRDDLLSKLCPVDYDPEAKCPQWLAFLDRIFNGNQEIIRFLQRAVGYSLSGITSEQVLFILYGSGANGKTTFLNTIFALLGDYAAKTHRGTLMVQKYDTIPNDLAALQGARFVCAAEGEVGSRLNEGRIKEMTGEDTLSARFLYGEWFSYQPKFKLWFATNHKPTVNGTDEAIWRRIRLIPFEVCIPPEDRDRTLMTTLKGELPGILNWALGGFKAWQEKGLEPCKTVQHATCEYRTEMDTLAAFIEECCIQATAAAAGSTELYEAYRVWCEQNGEKSSTHKRLGMRLKEKGYVNRRGSGGRYQWHGLGLLARPTNSEG